MARIAMACGRRGRRDGGATKPPRVENATRGRRDLHAPERESRCLRWQLYGRQCNDAAQEAVRDDARDSPPPTDGARRGEPRSTTTRAPAHTRAAPRPAPLRSAPHADRRRLAGRPDPSMFLKFHFGFDFKITNPSAQRSSCRLNIYRNKGVMASRKKDKLRSEWAARAKIPRSACATRSLPALHLDEIRSSVHVKHDVL
ncbi:unnamed protein product, partial [Iphiclides podalirius]